MKAKNKFFIIVLCAFGCLSVSAQSDKWDFGFNAGLGQTNWVKNYSTSGPLTSSNSDRVFKGGPAQDFSGYVVLNSGDTLFGLIKPFDNEAVMYHEVRFFKDGEKTKFEPSEILGYTFDEFIFLTRQWRDDSGPERKAFMRILEQGYCTLFTYVPQIKGIDIYDPTFNSGKINSAQYYLQRTGEDLHRIDFKKLRTGQDPYFSDNPQLAYDIQRGKYNRLGIEGAVSRYNKEWNEAKEREK